MKCYFIVVFQRQFKFENIQRIVVILVATVSSFAFDQIKVKFHIFPRKISIRMENHIKNVQKSKLNSKKM